MAYCTEVAIEEWRPVPGFEGYYEISSLGRLKRVKGVNGTKAGTIRKFQQSHKGYLIVFLKMDGIRSYRSAHELVCAAFIGPRPSGTTINHKDGNKENNTPHNLEYVTNYENYLHAVANGLRNGRVPKITASEAREIRNLNGHLTAKDVSLNYGISVRSVYCIWEGKTWKHV